MPASPAVGFTRSRFAGHGREVRGGCMAPPGGEEENGLWRKDPGAQSFLFRLRGGVKA